MSADRLASMAEIRRIAAEWGDRGATWCMRRIAALVSGGDHG